MDRTELIKKKPEFFQDQKPFLHPHFVKAFQKLLDSKTERERNELNQTGVVKEEDIKFIDRAKKIYDNLQALSES